MQLLSMKRFPGARGIDDLKNKIRAEIRPEDLVSVSEYNFLEYGAVFAQFKEVPENSDAMDFSDGPVLSIALSFPGPHRFAIATIAENEMLIVVYPRRAEPFAVATVDLSAGQIVLASKKSEREPRLAQAVASEVYRCVYSLISGHYELTAAKSTPAKLKNGKLRAARYAAGKRRAGLTASHTRGAFFRVLKNPRYYEGGVVPDDPDKLRRVPVRACEVNREIRKYNATEA